MNRTTFWLVWVVGGGPLCLAMFMYFFGFSTSVLSHKGELLEKGEHVTNWQLIDSKQQQWQQPSKWQLLITLPKECAHRCGLWHGKLEKVVTALGKDRDRVTFIEVATTPTEGKWTASAQYRIEPGVWIADPLGNLVLHYQFDQQPEDLLKDLRKLLKISRIG